MAENSTPIRLYRHPDLYLKQSANKGRGLFCAQPIKSGTVIEVAPCLIYNETDAENVRKTPLKDYIFQAAGFSNALYCWLNVNTPSKAISLVMGLASFCNHDMMPNADYEIDEQENTGYVILKAIKDIPQDTEICISYGVAWFASRNNKTPL